MAEDNLLGRIRRVGYAVLPLLDSAELETARAAAEALAAPTLADPSNNPWNRLPVRTSATDGIEYTEHVPRVASLCDGSAAAVSLQRVVADARLRGFAAAALGADAVILDNIQLMAAPQGFVYRQGYHRDLIVTHDDDVDTIPAMLTEDYFHNNIQFNLPLEAGDRTFWAVPGSHNRTNTPEEAAAFDHRPLNAAAPLEAEMPGAVAIDVPAGSVLLCNHHLIHRGCGPSTGLPTRRLTLHGGWHSAAAPPTLHFKGNLPKEGRCTPLAPEFERLLFARDACEQEHAEVLAKLRFAEPVLHSSAFTGHGGGGGGSRE